VDVLKRSQPPFCLWLIGGLGAGKTTICGHLLRALGLSPAMPVTSPTFTYVNEYRVGDAWYAHLDLYRCGPQTSLEEFGLVDARPYHGFFVEWPSAVPASPALTPTHILSIETVSDHTRELILTEP
jgi:tRNA threonylcarbamoyl adenosine modification protein YjeE